MTANELKDYLTAVVKSGLKHAVMIWGMPGIGKSSVVQAVCADNNVDFIDVRLSQLMPSDLRGIPVPDDAVTQWYPPAFLPRSGCGVLFLDELNMAAPSMQGVAQQLILDRKVGDYCLPDGWFVWAAGNQKSAKAAVFDMPAPLANRFLHLNLESCGQTFRQYAYRQQLHPDIIGFLSFRPDLLHSMHPSEPNWPSPRTWHMASDLHKATLDISPAVGASAANEFAAFCSMQNQLPDCKAILAGESCELTCHDPSVLYAIIAALVVSVSSANEAVHGFNWLRQQASKEWVHLFALELFPRLREIGHYAEFTRLLLKDADTRGFLTDFAQLMA